MSQLSGDLGTCGLAGITLGQATAASAVPNTFASSLKINFTVAAHVDKVHDSFTINASFGNAFTPIIVNSDNIRVSQVPFETLVEGPQSANIRVSQVPFETLVEGPQSANIRVSQVPWEVLTEINVGEFTINANFGSSFTPTVLTAHTYDSFTSGLKVNVAIAGHVPIGRSFSISNNFSAVFNAVKTPLGDHFAAHLKVNVGFDGVKRPLRRAFSSTLRVNTLFAPAGTTLDRFTSALHVNVGFTAATPLQRSFASHLHINTAFNPTAPASNGFTSMLHVNVGFTGIAKGVFGISANFGSTFYNTVEKTYGFSVNWDFWCFISSPVVMFDTAPVTPPGLIQWGNLVSWGGDGPAPVATKPITLNYSH